MQRHHYFEGVQHTKARLRLFLDAQKIHKMNDYNALITGLLGLDMCYE